MNKNKLIEAAKKYAYENTKVGNSIAETAMNFQAGALWATNGIVSRTIYEYMKVPNIDVCDERDLDSFGENGWEFVNVIGYKGTHSVGLFKRVKRYE